MTKKELDLALLNEIRKTIQEVDSLKVELRAIVKELKLVKNAVDILVESKGNKK